MKEITAITTLKRFYGISREALHIISGISADALKRYELGRKEPPRKYQLLIEAMMNIETFERLFHAAKARLKASDIERIEKTISSEMARRSREVREYRHQIMTITIK